MRDGDDESSRTLWVGNLHEKVTEEMLYELFLQAGPLERVALPAGKPYAFVVFQHQESVMYSKELMNGVQLFGQYLKMQPRTQSSSANNPARQKSFSGSSSVAHKPPAIPSLVSPSFPQSVYLHGQHIYGQQYSQLPSSPYNPCLPDSQRLNRLQQEVQRQLALNQQQQQQQYQQSYRRLDPVPQWKHQGHHGYR